MTDYREDLEGYQKEFIMEKFPQYVHNYGGLFVSETRQNLLKINPKNSNPIQDTPKQWSNIKKSVRNGFIDIQLVCSIASSNQLRKMFEHIPDYPEQETGGIVPDEFVNIVSPNLIPALSAILNSGSSNNEKQQKWKSDLALRIIDECVEYFLRSHIIRSPIHERHLREVNAILKAELNY